MIECNCNTWATSNFSAFAKGNGHNPSCDKYSVVNRIWRVNDTEWWLAPTLDEATKSGTKMYGISEDEFLDDPYELSDEELCRLKYVDDDGSKHSFFEELMRRANFQSRVEIFASTEY